MSNEELKLFERFVPYVSSKVIGERTFVELSFKDFSGYSEKGDNGEYIIRDQLGKELFRKVNDSIKKPTLEKFIVNNDEHFEEESYSLFKIVEDDSVLKVQTKGFIGVIQIENIIHEDKCYDVKITIGSRFDTNDKQYFLSYMLSGDFDNFNDYSPNISEENIFEVLLFYLFKVQLIKALKQGIYKTYKRFDYNDDKCRGAINIPRHIKLNIPFNGKMAYSVREHTFDNDINYLILHTYNWLKIKYPEKVNKEFNNNNEGISNGFNEGNDVLKKLMQIREVTPGFFTSRVEKVAANCSSKISHPFFQDYEPLRVTCLRILKNMGVSVFDGSDDKIKGILFYVPRLWEEFLYNKFEQVQFEKEKFVVKQQVPIDILKRNSNSAKEIKPDFVFYNKTPNSEVPIFILDAKYKPKWFYASKENKFDYVFDDYLQVSNYMLAFNTHNCGVIFPIREIESQKIVHECSTISKHNISHFHMFGLPVPKVEESNSYEAWCKKFNEGILDLLTRNNSELMKLVNKIVEVGKC